MPDGTQTYVGGGDHDANIGPRIAPADERNEQRAGHQAQGPVEVRSDQGEYAGEQDSLHRPLRIREPSQTIEQSEDRARRNAGMGGHHRDGELHGEGQKNPDAVAPGEDGFFDPGTGPADGQGQRDRRQDHADDPGIRNPAFGDPGQDDTQMPQQIRDHTGPIRISPAGRRGCAR